MIAQNDCTMKAVLVSVGSRGDAEPFCSLARQLMADGCTVELFLQTDLHYLAPPSVNLHAIPFTQMDMYQYVASPSHGIDHPNPRVRFIGVVTDVIAELFFPSWENLLAASMDANIIVCSSLARPLSLAIAQKLGIKTAIIHLQPLMPTKRFPHYSYTEEAIKAICKTEEEACQQSNEETYWEFEKFQFDFLKERLDDVCVKMEAPMQEFDDLRSHLKGDNENTLIVNAFSDAVVPVAPDSGKYTANVGPLADTYVASGWIPPSELVEFLEKCDKPPICIGYGSMPFDKVEAVSQAIDELKVDAVVVGDAFKEVKNDKIFQIASAPYPWLLPQCAMMLSHGGAGVVNATLRAGIPAVISPLMGDQMSWARLLEVLGLGVCCGTNLSTLSKEELVEGIEKASDCVVKCREIGKDIAKKVPGEKVLCEKLKTYLQ